MKKKVKKNKPKSKVSTRPKSSIGIKPFGDRVLVKPFTEEELKGNGDSHFGIILPETMSKEKSAQGKVVAVGDGKWDDGKFIAVKVKVGETVIFSKYAYDEVEHKGEEYYLLKEENILAILN